MPKFPRIGPPTEGISLYPTQMRSGGAAPWVDATVKSVNQMVSTAEIFGKIQAAADAAEIAQGQQVISRQLEVAIQNAKDTKGDPGEFQAFGNEQIDQIVKNGISGMRNEQTKSGLAAKLQDEIVKQKGAVQHHTAQLNISGAQGNFKVAMAEAIKRRTLTNDPVEQSRIDSQISGDLNELIRAGVFKPGEGPEKALEYRKGVDQERASWMVIHQPEAVEKALADSRNFPTMKESERYTLQQRALESMREKRVALGLAQKEKTDGINRDMLVAITAPGASLSVLREDVRTRVRTGILDAKDGEHWIDNIDKMIKEQNKPAKEAKEVDPYKTSDSAILAKVMSGVINNPERWDTQSITALMGNGLSVPHALRAVSLLEKAQKEPGGVSTPMKQAQKTWEDLQRNLSFLPSDQRLRNDPEARTTNNREAQRIFDQMQDRADKGEDPRVVLEELMQPHYDEKVKDFFSKDRWFPSYTRDEGVRAKQELIRRGLQPTEEAIKKTVEIFRRTENPYAAPSGRAGAPPATDRASVLERRVQELQREILERNTEKPKPALKVEY